MHIRCALPLFLSTCRRVQASRYAWWYDMIVISDQIVDDEIGGQAQAPCQVS